MHQQTWPETATAQSSVLASDWALFAYAGLAVAVLVWGLLLFAMLRWRRRRDGGPLPPQFRQNNALEIAWTAAPLLLVSVLFVYAYRAEAQVEALRPTPDVRVDVTAYRWGWTFAYAGGRTVDGAADAPPELVLPVDRTARIALTSSDVSHSFWVPDFLFKKDAIPGQINTFDLRPERIGTFVGRCAQFCGLNHALMDFRVRVVPPAEFARWLRARTS